MSKEFKVVVTFERREKPFEATIKASNKESASLVAATRYARERLIEGDPEGIATKVIVDGEELNTNYFNSMIGYVAAQFFLASKQQSSQMSMIIGNMIGQA